MKQTATTQSESHPKVTTAHLERQAYIYIRQSTLKQVHQNQESQRYQYRLQQRAMQLGWLPERVTVIDSDLGVSGREASARVGFQALVAAVSLGQVGIVFGYEVSRLARNNADWYHLLDLAAMFDTLIADNEGIYDPRLYNDRLLLGLKGTLSEAELHLLQQRLDQGRMNQIKRGDYRQRLPTGYVRLPDGRAVKDPDDQVRHAIELVLAKFEEVDSVLQVMRYLRQQKILLPRRQVRGAQAGQVVWKVASDSAVSSILKNPAYAGAFVYGRRQTDQKQRNPGLPTSGRVCKSMSEWVHIQQDVYPAYITWEQYLTNQERIHQNGLRFSENRQKAQGVIRNGAGLLQGIVYCGRCGRRMQTSYKGVARYNCCGLVRTADVSGVCCFVRASIVDELVVQDFFNALRPAQLDALDAILAAQQTEQARLERQWQEQLQRVQYEVHLAQRQYDAVEPENRLVAAELERRWETNLRQLRQVETDFHQFQQTPLAKTIPQHLRDLFSDVSQRLPDIWSSLANAQKKALLRALISHIILKRPVPDQAAVRIVWISGCYTDRTVRVNIHRAEDVGGYDRLVERIRVLWQQGYNDKQMSVQLTTEGFHTARSPHVPPKSIRKIRLARQWYLPLERLRRGEEVDGYVTVPTFAQQLVVHNDVIYRYIYKRVIAPEYIKRDPQTNFYLIQNDLQLIAQLRQQLTDGPKCE